MSNPEPISPLNPVTAAPWSALENKTF
ncbi:MAG: hypothetical protein JWP29_4492, partial [Rhodoferax sp.]|nr:hypothetical protein [Rhodoferax sp.]